MQQRTTLLRVATHGRGAYPVTAEVERFVREAEIETGLLTLWCRHTSASLVVTENASPAVLDDLGDWIAATAPEAPERYRHGLEGRDDMPAHLRAVLTGVQLTIPVAGGAPMLGTWQGVFLWEHRARPHRREIAVHLLGEPGRAAGVV